MANWSGMELKTQKLRVFLKPFIVTSVIKTIVKSEIETLNNKQQKVKSKWNKYGKEKQRCK